MWSYRLLWIMSTEWRDKQNTKRAGCWREHKTADLWIKLRTPQQNVKYPTWRFERRLLQEHQQQTRREINPPIDFDPKHEHLTSLGMNNGWMWKIISLRAKLFAAAPIECLCGLLAADFWAITLTADTMFGLFKWGVLLVFIVAPRSIFTPVFDAAKI